VDGAGALEGAVRRRRVAGVAGGRRRPADAPLSLAEGAEAEAAGEQIGALDAAGDEGADAAEPQRRRQVGGGAPREWADSIGGGARHQFVGEALGVGEVQG
jgi:hypothetical protein